MKRLLGRMAEISRLLAVLLLTASALRFGVAGFRSALSASAPVTDQRSSRSRDPQPAPPPPSADSVVPSSTEPPGDPVRVTLVVEVSARSEVLVNGRRVGHSPFVGDISCKRGNQLRVEVIPRDAPAITAVRTCTDGTVRVEAPRSE